MQNGLFRFLFRFSRGFRLCEGREAPAHLFVRSELTGVGLANPLLDQTDVVLVQREILIDGFIQDEAAVALLERGEGIEGLDFVAGGAEGDCLLLHAERIRCITAKYQLPAWGIAARLAPGWVSGVSARQKLPAPGGGEVASHLDTLDCLGTDPP
jgi:hypothetical protein